MKLGKIGIQKRIWLLLLSVVIFTFLALELASLQGFWGIWKNARAVSDRFDDKVTRFAGEMAVTRSKELILENAAEKARQVDRELDIILEDTKYLANSMTRILNNPDRYLPRQLPTPYEEQIPSRNAYLLITPGVREECAEAAVQQEIALAANVVDIMEAMAYFYDKYDSSCYFGSKHGYFISLDCYEVEEMYGKIHTENYHESYDPRQRPWYKLAVSTGDAVFTDVYVGNDGYPEITCTAPYYDREGFAGAAGLDVHLESLYKLFSDRTLGSTNKNFAINSRGEIIFSSEDEGVLAVGDGQRNLRKVSSEGLASAAEDMTAGGSDIMLVTLEGEDYYLAYAPIPSTGWSFGTLLKRDEVLAPVTEARQSLSVHARDFKMSMANLLLKNFVIITMLLLALLYLFFHGSRRTSEKFVGPILKLTEGVRDIAKGDLDKKLEIRTGDEIEELSDTVNHMTTELREYMANISKETSEKQRIATELALSKEIQEGMLPDIYPQFCGNPHYELAATMHAARQVGGDFYDFYNIDENHLALTVGDVSGKGIPASLFMVISKTILKNSVMAAIKDSVGPVDWAGAIERANRQLCENNEEIMFVTVFFGVLNIATGEFVYVNGGHNAPLIGRVSGDEADWKYIRDKKKFHMLGAFDDAKYMENSMTLKPGDMLYLYTDGVTEAMDQEGNLYTEERLRDTLCRVAMPEIKMDDILASVREDIDDHARDAEQSDDITMLGIRFCG